MGKREFLWTNHYSKIFCFCVHSGAPDLIYPGASLHDHILWMHLWKNRTYERTFPVRRKEINVVKVRFTMMYSSRKLNNKKVIYVRRDFPWILYLPLISSIAFKYSLGIVFSNSYWIFIKRFQLRKKARAVLLSFVSFAFCSLGNNHKKANSVYSYQNYFHWLLSTGHVLLQLLTFRKKSLVFRIMAISFSLSFNLSFLFILQGIRSRYASVNSSCAQSSPPPPGWTPGISIFSALDSKFPGVGTLELSNPPGVGTKKEGNAPSSVNTATFFIGCTVE